MAAAALDRRHARSVELGIEAQTETEHLETLVEAMVAQIKTQAATLAVVRHGLRRHRETLRTVTGDLEVAS